MNDIVETSLLPLIGAVSTDVSRSGLTFSDTVSLIDGSGFPNPFTHASPNGVISFWLRLSALPSGGNHYTILSVQAVFGVVFYLRFAIDASGFWSATFTAADGTTTATFTQTSNAFPADGTYHHVIMNWDTQAGTIQTAIDRTLVTTSRVGSTGFDVGIQAFSNTQAWAIAGQYQGGNKLVGDLAELWFIIDQSLDLSVSSNLDKFETGGSSIDLGPTGAIPLGIDPFMFFSQRPQGYEAITFLADRTGKIGMSGSGPIPPATSPTVALGPYP